MKSVSCALSRVRRAWTSARRTRPGIARNARPLVAAVPRKAGGWEILRGRRARMLAHMPAHEVGTGELMRSGAVVSVKLTRAGRLVEPTGRMAKHQRFVRRPRIPQWASPAL